MRRAYLSLGSNLGDRARHLASGVQIAAGTDPCRRSLVYQTEPIGAVVQDDFWNLVIELTTDATARQLLGRCRAAEAASGRIREQRWGPRTLDVDVVYLEGERSDDPEVLVPHPRLYERAFVLVPWHELAPDLVGSDEVARGLGRVVALGTLESLR